MAVIRHLEFSKFRVLVISAVLEVILLYSTKFHVNRIIIGRHIAKKTIFNMAAVRHLEFSKFGILVIRPVLEPNSALPYKISH